AAGKEIGFRKEALMKAYKSVFIAKAMETVINISLIEKTLSRRRTKAYEKRKWRR
ncbi:hypothetical protein AAVH_15149, partial [Aphelenchoides avenae]